jgi:hypothetical protein
MRDELFEIYYERFKALLAEFQKTHRRLGRASTFEERQKLLDELDGIIGRSRQLLANARVLPGGYPSDSKLRAGSASAGDPFRSIGTCGSGSS